MEDRINCSKIYQLREKFIEYWVDQGLDAVVCPSFASPALLPEVVDPLTFTACYTFIWNTLNFPAGILPVTLVKEDE
jgi:fatty acid amide hydrolase